MADDKVKSIEKVRVYTVNNSYSTIAIGLSPDIYLEQVDYLANQATDGQFFMFKMDLMFPKEYEQMVKYLQLKAVRDSETMTKYNKVAKKTNLRKFKLIKNKGVLPNGEH